VNSRRSSLLILGCDARRFLNGPRGNFRQLGALTGGTGNAGELAVTRVAERGRVVFSIIF